MRIDALPSELLLVLASYIDPADIRSLQQVSRRFKAVMRDAQLWKKICFDRSQAQGLLDRHSLLSKRAGLRIRPLLQQGLGGAYLGVESKADPAASSASKRDRGRVLADWDPEYAEEHADWFKEYIHRHAHISTSWLPRPSFGQCRGGPCLEVRGMALVRASSEQDSHEGNKIVAPLDDGSLCLWNLDRPGDVGSTADCGAVRALSKPGLLRALLKHEEHAPKADIVECISVDSFHQRAYVAVGDALAEVDLVTLGLVNRTSFPCPISALSEFAYPSSLTVGTAMALHIHDPRLPQVSRGSPLHVSGHRSGRRPTAALLQPGPVSIVHAPQNDGQMDDRYIYVAGRFSSILGYDRRIWPKLQLTLHSGGRLSALATLPQLPKANSATSFAPRDPAALGSMRGHTVVACGEYNGRGSLEIYGVPTSATYDLGFSVYGSTYSSYSNRQTASSSKLLSVITQGTCLVTSDGNGELRWVERDGSMRVRQHNINRDLPGDVKREARGSTSLTSEVTAGDAARKILPVELHYDATGRAVDRSGVVVWTGDRIGLLSYSTSPLFDREELSDPAVSSLEESHRESQERLYAERMRSALQRQADEVRFMQGLGLALQSGDKS